MYYYYILEQKDEYQINGTIFEPHQSWLIRHIISYIY